jgi:xanthine dehydrogenase molybdenum-binding subunit
MSEVADAVSTVSFEVNGTPVSVRSDHPHLLAALREELGVTSAKDGCSPSGQCGCCTVMIDGKAQVSCQFPVARAEGRSITTLEGVDEEERERFANAFAACGGLQCGFCIPGIVMRAKSQIDKKGADLKRADMARHLGAHLCRCTGYVKVLDAIETVAKGTPVEVCQPGGVGSRGVKYESTLLALGDRHYVDDMRVEGMLHAALHLTEHVRADILRIDTSAAEAAPGVVAVYTRRDVPGQNKVGIIHKDWPVFIGEGERTSYAGDVLAIVVADTKVNARAAAKLVKVDYRPLRPIVDAVAAIDDPEIAVHGTDSNVLSRSEYSRGDAGAALAASAHVVHETFRTQRIEHAFLEPESTLAVPDPATGTMLVYSGGQGVWDDRDQICALGHCGAGVERRRIRRQGGHVEPGPDRTRRLAAAAAGEVHPLARGEPAHPCQAPPDSHGVLRGLRRRGETHRGPRPDGR